MFLLELCSNRLFGIMNNVTIVCLTRIIQLPFVCYTNVGWWFITNEYTAVCYIIAYFTLTKYAGILCIMAKPGAILSRFGRDLLGGSFSHFFVWYPGWRVGILPSSFSCPR